MDNSKHTITLEEYTESLDRVTRIATFVASRLYDVCAPDVYAQKNVYSNSETFHRELIDSMLDVLEHGACTVLDRKLLNGVVFQYKTGESIVTYRIPMANDIVGKEVSEEDSTVNVRFELTDVEVRQGRCASIMLSSLFTFSKNNSKNNEFWCAV